MPKTKIVMPEYVELLPDDIETLKHIGDTTLYSDFPKTDDEIVARIGDAEIVLTQWIRVTSDILDRCPNIKYIITLSAGINWIDCGAATKKGIKISNSPTWNSHAVAEHAIGLMFTVSKHVVVAHALIQKGGWPGTPRPFEGAELAGKKLCIIGYGQIGKHVATIAKGIGMSVSFTDNDTPADDLDKHISMSDYISLHVPSTKETFHLIDGRRLNLMKKTAFLINTSRGEIVDQKTLLHALKEGKIAGAGLDVFEGEPASNTGSLSQEIIELANLPNVTATPHTAYYTREATGRLGREVVENVKSCLLGNPINVKN